MPPADDLTMLVLRRDRILNTRLCVKMKEVDGSYDLRRIVEREKSA
jgi:hypothetical protein